MWRGWGRDRIGRVWVVLGDWNRLVAAPGVGERSGQAPEGVLVALVVALAAQHQVGLQRDVALVPQLLVALRVAVSLWLAQLGNSRGSTV